MTRPLLYELHTRCWLREWSERLGHWVGLDEVPEEELSRWRELGFTHIWLMGIWATSERSRRRYLEAPETVRHWDAVMPGWSEADVPGSPYAIAGYQVPAALGGEMGLQRFRARLHAHGLRLVLDFIPNHVGLDHPWVWKHPERFISTHSPQPGVEVAAVETSAGRRWLAHGKDPWFPAWWDTLQLDYRRADTRAAMVAELRSVASRCDGVRCDMAMLVLEDVFAGTWSRVPCLDPAPGEFWAEAIPAVRAPDFMLLAEAYWDLEERLQALGFDYAYDKRVTDGLMARDGAGLTRLLQGRTREFLRRSVHFLENHDEPRVAGRLSLEEHRAAALLVMGLPGVALMHEGQLSGARVRASIHLNRRVPEPVDHSIARMYERLFSAIRESTVGGREGVVIQARAQDPVSALGDQVLMVAWDGGPAAPLDERRFDLVVINFSPSAGRYRFEWPGSRGREAVPRWRVRDRLGAHSSALELPGGPALVLDIPAHAAQLLQFQPGRP